MLSIAKGETSAAETARKHSLTIAEIERWQEQFFAAGENALRARPKDEEAAEDEQVERLKKKVGELVLDIDILGGGEQGPPFRAGDVRRVRQAFPQALRAARLPAARRAPLEHAHCPSREACAPTSGHTPGSAHPRADSPAPDLRLPQALGAAQVHRRSRREPEGGLPHPQGQALVRTSADRHAPPARPRPQERRAGVQHALGYGPHPHLLRRRRLGPPGRDHRLPEAARSSAGSSACAGAPGKRSAPSRAPVCTASVPCVPKARRRS